jgi:hypothetical protein
MLNPLVLALLLPVQPQVSFGASVGVQVAVPTVQFEVEPPLVVVAPGVMVVEDYGTEVYFVNGYYWTMSGGAWYRTRNYRGGWVSVPRRVVPYRIARVPPGRYRHFRGGHRYNRGPARYRGRPTHRGPARYDRGPSRYDRGVRHERGDRRHTYGGGGRHGRH